MSLATYREVPGCTSKDGVLLFSWDFLLLPILLSSLSLPPFLPPSSPPSLPPSPPPTLPPSPPPPPLPQADPLPSIRKFLVEFLEDVVKANPSFCQPGMVDVYSYALLSEASPTVLKRVVIAATNVHRSVLR